MTTAIKAPHVPMPKVPVDNPLFAQGPDYSDPKIAADELEKLCVSLEKQGESMRPNSVIGSHSNPSFLLQMSSHVGRIVVEHLRKLIALTSTPETKPEEGKKEKKEPVQPK